MRGKRCFWSHSHRKRLRRKGRKWVEEDQRVVTLCQGVSSDPKSNREPRNGVGILTWKVILEFRCCKVEGHLSRENLLEKKATREVGARTSRGSRACPMH